MNPLENNSRRDFLKHALISVAGVASTGCINTPSTRIDSSKALLPPPLKKGDTIGFFSPSTPATSFAHKRFARAQLFLKSEGYQLKAGSLTGQSDYYRSGSIEARANELNELIRDPNVRCIMSTMGGMVSNAMLPYLDYDALKNDPKIIIGYSDVTAILHGIYAKTGITTYYGPALVASFGELGYFLDKTYHYFKEVVTKAPHPHTIKNPTFWTEQYVDWETQSTEKVKTANQLITLNSGSAQGRLIVANLNTLSGIFGTDYFTGIRDGDILLLEDSFKDAATTERSYAHLKLAGVFDKIGGLIIGKHEKFDDRGSARTNYHIAMEVIGKVNFPILAQYDCAHTHPMITLPIGVQVKLDATKQELSIL